MCKPLSQVYPLEIFNDFITDESLAKNQLSAIQANKVVFKKTVQYQL